jgi:hypothetical protein
LANLARQLARRLADDGVSPEALREVVTDIALARADANNVDGLEAQLTFLLDVSGPEELVERLVRPAA